jgi:NAD(P)H-nitrite reductase large subunit
MPSCRHHRGQSWQTDKLSFVMYDNQEICPCSIVSEQELESCLDQTIGDLSCCHSVASLLVLPLTWHQSKALP